MTDRIPPPIESPGKSSNDSPTRRKQETKKEDPIEEIKFERQDSIQRKTEPVMLRERSPMMPDDMDEAIDEVSEIREDSPNTVMNSVSESSKLAGPIITPIPVD